MLCTPTALHHPCEAHITVCGGQHSMQIELKQALKGYLSRPMCSTAGAAISTGLCALQKRT